jgi:hypothetical protein
MYLGHFVVGKGCVVYLCDRNIFPLSKKAYSTREGLRLATDARYVSIIVEGDANEVVKLCNTEDPDNLEISPIYQEIR